MNKNENALALEQRRIEPVDITDDKTQIVLDHGSPEKTNRLELPTDDKRAGEGVTIQSVDRALSILEHVAGATRPAKLQEIAEALDLKSPTCYHLLNSLVKRGFVTRNQHPRTYQLGPKINEMSRRERSHFEIRQTAIPHLERLAEDTGHTACMAVFSGTELTITVDVEAASGISIIAYRQHLSRAPHATALGKAILAWLPEPQIARVVADRGLTGFTDLTIVSLGDLVESLRQVRRHGFAVDAGEYSTDVFSLAAAIRNPAGGVIGSIGCLARRNNDDLKSLREVQQRVIATSKAISDACC
ncbi:IclR family transcriptional regulator [Labrenzia sp. 011]|uniref:IclR family transcriptional regulator n=1 Tax=Labrenzia sp. 011 TaxID=2171494 RepID=UPI000E31983B|nr:IclR family transcriptional regulator [Labrenzia sp. 011]